MRVLIVDNDPLADPIVECLGERMAVEVDYARSGTLGARLIGTGLYDIALIDSFLPEILGTELAAFAADMNTPALLISRHPATSVKLGRLGFPYIEKPFHIDRLCDETRRATQEPAAAVSRLKAASTRLQANVRTLAAAMETSNRLLDEIKIAVGGRGRT
nr:hypothetical protein [uncultured Rhodopila sp.]